MSEVIWKKFHNIEVSNTGLVKTRNHKDGKYNGNTNTSYYKQIWVRLNNKRKCYLMHRLVMHVFKDFDLDSDLQINHKNCKRDDNRVENLEIVDNRENQQKTKKHITGKLYGVTLKKDNMRRKPWCGYITNKLGKQIYLGYYKTELDAHIIVIGAYENEFGVKPQCTCNYCKELEKINE